MPVDETSIKDLIEGAWCETLRAAKGESNKRKAERWVDCLGKAFLKHYKESSQTVFWCRNEANWQDFRLKELLFDVSVCEIKKGSSISGRVRLPFVSHCYWQVESEVNDSDSREITKDFSKLVMGNSDNKLFVSSLVKHKEAAKNLSSDMACHCKGNLYLCFIPHPRDWGKASDKPELLKWSADYWSAL